MTTEASQNAVGKFKRILKIGNRQQKIPAGEYLAQIVEIKPGTFIGKRATLHFQFKIVDEKYRDIVLNGFVNANYESYSEYTKLYQWYKAATGWSLNSEEEIDLDRFLDRLLKVKVEDRKSKKTGNPFSNVTEILELVKEF